MLSSLQFVFFLSCKDPSQKLLEAESLHQKGEIKAAIQAYDEAIKENHSLSTINKANEQLQNIYMDYAKKFERTHPETSLQISIITEERWPGSKASIDARERRKRIEQIKQAEQIQRNSDKNACDKARKENTRASWKVYSEEFPVGKCIKEARDRLNRSPPSSEQRIKFQSLLNQCKSFQSECLRLEGRYTTIVAKKEISYMTSVLHAFIKSLVEKMDSNRDEIETLIATLHESQIDTKELKDTFVNECPPCDSAIANLADIEGCQEAIKMNTAQSWNSYSQAFPNGGCLKKSR